MVNTSVVQMPVRSVSMASFSFLDMFPLVMPVYFLVSFWISCMKNFRNNLMLWLMLFSSRYNLYLPLAGSQVRNTRDSRPLSSDSGLTWFKIWLQFP